MEEEVVLRVDLRALRNEAGLSADQVAKQSGIACSVIKRLELGESINLTTALKMARFLHLSVEDIWEIKNKEN
jgi:DNA-binding XRE family transcriptional regulator